MNDTFKNQFSRFGKMLKKVFQIPAGIMTVCFPGIVDGLSKKAFRRHLAQPEVQPLFKRIKIVFLDYKRAMDTLEPSYSRPSHFLQAYLIRICRMT